MQWHLTLAHPDRAALFPSEAHRLRAVRVLVRVVGPRLILYCVADDHVHVWVFAEPSRVAQLAGNLGQALRFVAGQVLDPARVRPVESRRHGENMLRYLLDQSSHHQLATSRHPACWEGSAFPDLVGARLVPGFLPGTLLEALPRLKREEVYAAVGLAPFEAADDRRLSSLGVDALAEAARSALCLPSLAGNEPDQVRARSVAARLAHRLGMPTVRAAEALGVTVRSVQRSAARPPDDELDAAVRKWVALRDAAHSYERATP